MTAAEFITRLNIRPTATPDVREAAAIEKLVHFVGAPLRVVEAATAEARIATAEAIIDAEVEKRQAAESEASSLREAIDKHRGKAGTRSDPPRIGGMGEVMQTVDISDAWDRDLWAAADAGLSDTDGGAG